MLGQGKKRTAQIWLRVMEGNAAASERKGMGRRGSERAGPVQEDSGNGDQPLWENESRKAARKETGSRPLGAVYRARHSTALAHPWCCGRQSIDSRP